MLGCAGLKTEEIKDKLVNLTIKMESIEVYSFVQYMIDKIGSEEWMRIQIDVLTIGLKEFRNYGTYSIALFYVRELYSIRETADNQKLLIHILEEVGRTAVKECVYEIAKEILMLEPENEWANMIIQAKGINDT